MITVDFTAPEWAHRMAQQIDAAVNRARGAALPSYAVASLPKATPAGRMIYVTNEAGGATVAFSDGTNWRRVADRAVVS